MKTLPVGAQAIVLSKLYYGALTKSLEKIGIDRYFATMQYIYNNDHCCQQEICDKMMIDKTAMVKVLDYLSKAGFIRRKVNPVDRRKHFIVLSEKGRKQTRAIVSSLNNIDNAAFKGISDSSKKIFLNVLEDMCDNLKKLPSNEIFFNYSKTRKK